MYPATGQGSMRVRDEEEAARSFPCTPEALNRILKRRRDGSNRHDRSPDTPVA